MCCGIVEREDIMEKNYKFLRHLPNACTLGNMACGVLAILISVFHSSHKSTKIACLFILLGAFLDGIDGRLARKLKVSSPMGKELDSFADAITFGLAPMLVFLAMHSTISENSVTMPEVLVSTFYILCAVFRLARYNISDHSSYFVGLPTTASGMFLSLYIFFSNEMTEKWAGDILYTAVSYGIIFLLGTAMVSTVKVNRL